MPKRYFITGIGTGIGKTLVSAILCEAWEADYWKPIQAGFEDETDTHFVRKNLSNKVSKVFPERYKLKLPASPHLSAGKENIEMRLTDFKIPGTENILIAEGAGGLLVPLNDSDLMVDLINYLKMEVIVVSQFYLGSINHSLLTAEALAKRNIPVAGVVFNGDKMEGAEEIILKHTHWKKIAHIPMLSSIDKEVILSLSRGIAVPA
jgi:dethiobiotin synthetase